MEGFSSGTHKLIHLIRFFWNKARILHHRIPVHESLFQLIENERMVGRFVEQRQKLIELAGTIGCELGMLSWWSKSNLIKFMTITLERYGEPTWVFNATGGLSIRERDGRSPGKGYRKTTFPPRWRVSGIPKTASVGNAIE